jgi:hypothetical protein
MTNKPDLAALYRGEVSEEVEAVQETASEEVTEKKTGVFKRLGNAFHAVAIAPVKKFVVTPLKCVFDLVAMPYRDAYVYPFENVRGGNMSRNERLINGSVNLGTSAAIGAGVAFAVGFLLPIVPVSATAMVLCGLYGKPVVNRLYHKSQLGGKSEGMRSRMTTPKTMFFPSLRQG